LKGHSTEDVGTFYGRLVYFKASWYILWPFGFYGVFLYIFPVLVRCTEKNLATLVQCDRIGHTFATFLLLKITL
jgi:hypothetical protein